jgi:hypothetical protein
MVHLQTEASQSIWDHGEMSSSFNVIQLPMDSSWGDMISSSMTLYPPHSSPLPQLQEVSLTLKNTPIIHSSDNSRELVGPSDETDDTTRSALESTSEEQAKAGPRRSGRQSVTTAQYAALDWSYEQKRRTLKKQRIGI